jgi:sulfur carrier protein
LNRLTPTEGKALDQFGFPLKHILNEMEVKFNGDKISTSSSNLSEILSENKLLGKIGIAVAINNTVIPKSDWNETPLNQNDEILIITAAAGG